MRQRHWMETSNDYDCEIIYRKGKANVVADALSRKEHEKPKRGHALILELKIDLLSQIKEAQKLALEEGNIKAGKENSAIDQLLKGNYEILRLSNRKWILIIGNLRERIPEEAYKSKYKMHLGSDKIYHNLKSDYWLILRAITGGLL
ncbi:uncharacterized protein LOC143548475 [Bidens hawaiensis]|uniref:uncharacterized protein LOC143548475 n=1 Tax=Bidens hawaiensis TaxID=980011 RepID=UPI00404A4BFE